MTPILAEQTPQPGVPTGLDLRRGRWDKTLDIKDFLHCNIHPYIGDETFLCGPTERTRQLWRRCMELIEAERKAGGVLDIDTSRISTIDSHPAGYIDKDAELIVGLQTDAPLRRSVKPLGGIRIVERACHEHGYELSPAITEMFLRYRKTHNDAVFQAYTEDVIIARRNGLITGLPDAYSRGRIIGDYRRVALYGLDYLVAAKLADKKNLDGEASDELIQLREEVTEQINALGLMKRMAASYGYDISRPAGNAREAIQWTYFAYLSAIKEQDGAAMSLGSVSNFFDVYIEHDLATGVLDEPHAQELIDDVVIKLRMVRHLRSNAYNDLFSGDPTWITESVGGMGENGKPKVTKTSFRFLQTLFNLGPAPEPNLTVLWSDRLPEPFKRFCAKVSLETSAIQYENDDLMRPIVGDDYGISCCVSRNKAGSEMQYFGARCNLVKMLLYALNGGRDEISGDVVVTGVPELSQSETLDIQEVRRLYDMVQHYAAGMYVKAMNIIHAMHDRYYYERAQMALLDTRLDRIMAFGVAGLSVLADSLSAIRYAKVRAVRDDRGLTKEFVIEGDFPKFGNDDECVDARATDLVRSFLGELRRHPLHRNARHSLSILTITSNVVYGRMTGATPDGRKGGEPFAPGANPMHGRDQSGALAALNSIAQLPYSDCSDGISNTFSILPATLGKSEETQLSNLVGLLDGYFRQGGHHMNVNVLDREQLLDAIDHPDRYPQLTIRVSGYAVNFVKLTRAQQMEVIARTFHSRM